MHGPKYSSVAARAKRTRWLRRQVVGLCAGCPYDRTNPCICPLCEVRTLTPQEQSAWLKQLTQDELEYMVVYHAYCLSAKCAADRAQLECV